MKEVLTYIAFLILPILALVIPSVLLKNRLRDKLWLKWAMIISGVWLAQNTSFWIGWAVLKQLYGSLAVFTSLIPIRPHFQIWQGFLGTFRGFVDWLLFFFVYLVPYFVIGTIIGLIIQKVKAVKKEPEKEEAN